jgi:hypothetical protein
LRREVRRRGFGADRVPCGAHAARPLARVPEKERTELGLEPDDASAADDERIEVLGPLHGTVDRHADDLRAEPAFVVPRVTPEVAAKLRREDDVLRVRHERTKRLAHGVAEELVARVFDRVGAEETDLHARYDSKRSAALGRRATSSR